MSNIIFKHIDHPHIENIFLQALEGYPEIKKHELELVQRSIPKTTMRAQPILDWKFFFKKRRAYRIEMSNHISLSEYIKIEELPEEVLLGWFAHELGHVQDYLHRSGWNMITFAIGYVLFPTFQMGVERRADVFAIQAGFAQAILATKKYILEHSTLPDRYKKRIEKYYMSPDEVALMLAEEEDLKLDKLI